jgi:ferredoxin
LGRKEKSKYMAELINKYPQNAAGSFYVPESPEEEALCKEAMEGCPVEAIGDDSE